jgi:hypothetical protein
MSVPVSIFLSRFYDAGINAYNQLVQLEASKLSLRLTFTSRTIKRPALFRRIP